MSGAAGPVWRSRRELAQVLATMRGWRALTDAAVTRCIRGLWGGRVARAPAGPGGGR